MKKYLRLFGAATVLVAGLLNVRIAHAGGGGGGGGGPIGTSPPPQLRSWMFGPNRIDFVPGASPSVSPVSGVSGTSNNSYAAAYDAANQLLFYADPKTNTVYTNTGAYAGSFAVAQSTTTLDDWGTNYVVYGRVINDVVVAPVPGACKQFYLFTHSIAPLSNIGLICTPVDCSSGTPVVGTSQILWEGYGKGGLALSRADAAGSRFLYEVVGGNVGEVHRYPITTSGLGASTTALTFPPTGYTNEVELSPDGTRLGFVGLSGRLLHCATVTPSTGAVSNLVSAALPNSATLNGIEFSPDSRKLYCSYSGTSTPGVCEWTLATNAVVAPLPGTASLSSTQLELAYDGLIYGITGTSASVSGQLGTLNPNTNAFALSPVTTLIERGYYPPQLPDQVDGEDYSFFFGTPAPTISAVAVDGTPTSTGPGTSGTLIKNVYSCQALPVSVTATNAATYQLTVTQTQANGTLNAAAYQYTTSVLSALPTDLRSLDNSYLASHPGYYRVLVRVLNACGDQASRAGYIRIGNAPATAANVRYLTGQAGDPLQVPGNSASTATGVGGIGGGLDFSQVTDAYSSFQVRIEEASSGTLIVDTGIGTSQVVMPQLPFNYLVYINAGPNAGATNYFASHLGTPYRVTVTLYSGSCGAATTIGYFVPTTTSYRSASATSLAPNPLKGAGMLTYSLSAAQSVRVVLVDALSGKEVRLVQPLVKQPAGEYRLKVDASGLPEGVYLYKILTDSKVETGRITIAN